MVTYADTMVGHKSNERIHLGRDRVSVEIIIKSESDQVFTPDYGVPTIRLGDGETIISDVHTEDNQHGICFSEAEINLGVGADQPCVRGATVTDIGAYLQILTSNPASLDVLIDKCLLAKAALLKENI